MPVRWSPRRRRVLINLLAADEAMKAGRLTPADRRVIDALLPGWLARRAENDMPNGVVLVREKGPVAGPRARSQSPDAGPKSQALNSDLPETPGNLRGIG
jgi:hypothetical protein